MDYVKPTDVVALMIEAGARKGALPVRDLLIRGGLSGAILGIATALAITTAVQTGTLIAGALIFPVGFVMIVLLGLELVTGSFALLPLAQMDGAIGWAATMRNWAWVFVGNLIGSVAFAFLLWGVLTMFGEVPGGPVADRIVASSPRPRPWPTRRTAAPAGPRPSSRRCSATGWSAWAS